MHKLKIFFSYNSKPPASHDKGGSYGWLNLPFAFNGKPVVIEERCGLYGGPYIPSTGAPRVPGICSMGSFSYSYSPLPNGMKVGRYCSIAKGLSFLDSQHPTNLLTTSAVTFRVKNLLWKDLLRDLGSPQVKDWNVYANKSFPSVGHDVWIGKNVTLCMGIKLGNGSIVAANSVVTKDVPEYAIVGGNPAKIIRYRFDEATIRLLGEIAWWDLDPKQVLKFIAEPVVESLPSIESLKDDGCFYKPRTLAISKHKILLSTNDGPQLIEAK